MGSVRLHRDGYPKQGAEMHLFLADALGVPVWVIDLQEAVLDLSLLAPLVTKRLKGGACQVSRLPQGESQDFAEELLRSISSLGIEQKGG